MCRDNGQSGAEQGGDGHRPQGKNREEEREVTKEDGDSEGI